MTAPGDDVDVASWLPEVEAAIAGTGDADVACGSCTACCASSQFVHIGPGEADTLAHIPPALLFVAPGRGPGHRVLGYDERGRCPMLGDAGCTIYDHRPRTCRTYDCRVFAATGVTADQPAVAERAAAWRLRTATDADRAELDALRSAAAFLGEHPRLFPPNRRPGATGAALAAFAVRDLFRTGDPDPAEVAARLA